MSSSRQNNATRRDVRADLDRTVERYMSVSTCLDFWFGLRCECFESASVEVPGSSYVTRSGWWIEWIVKISKDREATTTHRERERGLYHAHIVHTTDAAANESNHSLGWLRKNSSPSSIAWVNCTESPIKMNGPSAQKKRACSGMFSL